MELIIDFIISFATVTLSLVSMIAAVGIVVTIGFAISYGTKRSFESKLESWQHLDQIDGLRFVPSPMLLGVERSIWYRIFHFAFAERSYVQGTYNDV